MKIKIDKIIGFFIDILIPLCLIYGMLQLLGYAVHRHQNTINEGIASGRLIKVDGYVFEKLTIDGHEYLKFNDGIAHSGNCPCSQKKEVEEK